MNKVGGGDGIPIELFQILKDDVVKVLHSICQQIWKTQQWPQEWKISVFISVPKKRQCQRMFKLPHNCTHLTHQQSNAENSPSKSSIVRELRTYRCSSWIQKRQRNKRSNCQHPLDYIKSKRIPEKNIYFCFTDYSKFFDCVDHNKLWKILNEMGVPDHLTCLLRNLYADQQATVRTRHGITNWFKIGKGV